MYKIWMAVSALALALTACSSTPNNATSSTDANSPTMNHASYNPTALASNSRIQSVVFSRAAAENVNPERWLKKELRIDSSLNVSLTDYNNRGQVVSLKRGRVKQADFDKMVSTLNQSNYPQLQPTERPQVQIGGVTDLVTISSSSGIYQFKQNDRFRFPESIQSLFTSYTNAK